MKVLEYRMKFISKFLHIILFSLALLGTLATKADVTDVTVKAHLDSASLLMGNVAPLRLEVEQPAGAKVILPLLKEGNGAYIPLLNDSVEIRQRFKVDTVKLGNDRIRVNYNLMIQSFDSGYYELPAFIFEYNGQQIASNKVSLTVIPVKAKADDEISGFTDVAEPEEATLKGPKSKFQSFLEKYWWVILLALVALAVAAWACIKAYRNYKATGSVLPPKPVIPPYEEAMKSLSKLRDRKLWENGREKEFYTGLTFILRRYLSKEYKIPAMEMTSAQIIEAFKMNPDLEAMRGSVRKILDMADFAKFAKVRPLAEDNEESFELTDEIIKTAHRLHDQRIAEMEAIKEKNSVKEKGQNQEKSDKSGTKTGGGGKKQ